MSKGDDRKMDMMNMLSLDELDEVRGGCFSGNYLTEVVSFLKEHMDEKTYNMVVQRGEKKPYVAAKVFLSPSDWRKYVWIEQHGSLDGFRE